MHVRTMTAAYKHQLSHNHRKDITKQSNCHPNEHNGKYRDLENGYKSLKILTHVKRPLRSNHNGKPPQNVASNFSQQHLK